MLTMRDTFIEEIYHRMHIDENIFFVTADFGSPILDYIRKEFPNNFINVGIAEQNLINVSTGLAMEGYTVFTYAIAPFITMRAYEQVRTNLSLLSQIREINVNMIGVGAGLSYDVSGPTHHCLEDLSIMRTLPNIVLFSPSDCILVKKFFDYSINIKKPKYIRLDGKPIFGIYNKIDDISFEDGFTEIKKGKEICLISTGFMTHRAINVSNMLIDNDDRQYDNVDIGIIDIYLLKPLNEDLLYEKIKKYKYIITLEEGFVGKGGLDSLISYILDKNDDRNDDRNDDSSSNIKLRRMGFGDNYVFDIGNRKYLHKLNDLSEEEIIKRIGDLVNK